MRSILLTATLIAAVPTAAIAQSAEQLTEARNNPAIVSPHNCTGEASLRVRDQATATNAALAAMGDEYGPETATQYTAAGGVMPTTLDGTLDRRGC